VARASYIDPRVIFRYQEGRTIAAVLGELGQGSDFGDLATRGGAERAVLDLLASA
jgi:DNA topoisomerase-1